MRFGFARAPRASGWLLIGIGVDEVLAWAPPGVAVGASGEKVGLWAKASWLSEGDRPWHREPATLVSCSVEEVTAAVPADFWGWVFACTREQIALLDTLLPCGGPRARRQVTRDLWARLRDELRTAVPDAP